MSAIPNNRVYSNQTLVAPLREAEDLHNHLDELGRSLEQIKLAIGAGTAVSAPTVSVGIDEKKIRNLIRVRRLREQQLGPDLFADPAWDILLEAFANKLEQRRASVTELCSVASVPPTTALRWLKKLEYEGWLTRISDPLDGRRHWIELTSSGSARIRDFLQAVWPSLMQL